MSIILDTNVISEARKSGDGRADRHVTVWLASCRPDSVYLSAVTLLELERGILHIERCDLRQGTRLRAWMTTRVLPEFAGRVLAVDGPVALAAAALHVPDPKPERDALIAATALVHGMAVATRNIADFNGMGVRLIDPWAPPAADDQDR